MKHAKLLGSSIGLLLIVAGLIIGVGPVIGLIQRSQADATAIQAWEHGSPSHISPSPDATPNTCAASTAPSSDYMLVTFPSLPQYGYALVAGNGNWSLLNDRSAVHWYQSPAPGGQGNIIVAFHREPDFEYINELNTQQTVQVQDRQCNVYSYTITGKWVLAPSQVTQLDGTSGYNLTMITCTPWWQDYDRIVWRATLTAVNGKPFTPPPSTGTTHAPSKGASQPTFS